MSIRALYSRPVALSGFAGMLLTSLLTMGCGGPGQGEVSGKVLFNKEPLPGGRVTFRPADPKQDSVSAELDEQGNYRAVLPAGEVLISVDNRELEPPPSIVSGRIPEGLPPEIAQKLRGTAKSQPAPAKTPDDAPVERRGRFVRIPTRYHEVETSKLQFKVQAGKQTHNIELEK